MSCDQDWDKFKERYGEYKTVSALLKALRQDRTTLDKEDTSRAKNEEDFATFYLTRSKGERRRLPMRKDIDIARLWRARHNLEARWWHSFI
jgi:hypothetical protein